MSEEFNKVESMIEQLKAYANTRVSQVKLSMAEKVSKLAAEMIAMLMAALVFFLFLVILSIAAAIFIGQWLENMWLGFVIVAGVILVVGLILWLSKDRLLRIPIMNKLIEALFEPEEDDEKN
ncbi:MAG: phage holin family protein [Saprospiraceae bacterium]|nr:phage holin family protein [Saprospiraceae bacterium]